MYQANGRYSGDFVESYYLKNELKNLRKLLKEYNDFVSGVKLTKSSDQQTKYYLIEKAKKFLD